ncbi:MAG: serine/threonine protein kinase [Crocosphaera sp.]
MFKQTDILSNNYQLKQRLGNTAKGHQTWFATDLETSEDVTVKLLAFSPEMEWSEFKLFEREAEVLQSLTHPRIPCYRDYFEIDKKEGNGIPWFALVQDYIPGSSLQELLDNHQKFSEQKVRKIAIDVLQILKYLHELNPPVLHRDIKPSNLILGEDNNIYLIDFGAVQAKAGVTGVTFTVVGTSGYSPLEQFWGKTVPSSDVYALGATLIHLLTGISPSELPHENYKIKFADKVKIKPSFLQWIETVTDIDISHRFKETKEALEVLKSGQFIKKKQASLPAKFFKPEKTEIKIIKTSHFLKISIPRKPLSRKAWKLIFKELVDGLGIIPLGIIFLFLCIIFILYFLNFLKASSVLIGFIFICSVIFFLIFLMIFLLVLAQVLLATASKFLVKEYSLVIEDEYCILKKLCWKGLGNQVNKFFLKELSSIFINRQDGNYKLKLRTSQKVHSLAAELQEDEAVWLVQEIEDWLNINCR